MLGPTNNHNIKNKNINNYNINNDNITLNNTNTNTKKVIFCFPFHHEFEAFHIKLWLLELHVDLFVLVESSYDDKGESKPLHFEQNKFHPEYQKYISNKKLINILNTFKPLTKGKQLGWTMTKSAKEMLGNFIVHNLSKIYPMDSIVLLGDADEIPSPQAIEWLKTNAVDSLLPNVYEFASSMPTFTYGFVWLHSSKGYSTLTARSMKNEISFWKAILDPNEQKQISQNVLPIPLYPSGWHCSYCFSSEACVEKLRHANLADGPPFLGLYEWTPSIFDLYRSCGIAPQGNPLESASKVFPKEKDMNYTSILIPLLRNTDIIMKYKNLFQVQKCSDNDLIQIQKQIPIIQKATCCL